MKAMFFLILSALLIFAIEKGSAQSSDLKKVSQYENDRLDKAEALAWSIFCPGGGLIYAGDLMGGIGSLGVNGYLSYSFLDAVDRKDWNRARTMALLSLVGRIADVTWAFSAVDDYNRQLRLSLGITASMIGSRPQPMLAINVRF